MSSFPSPVSHFLQRHQNLLITLGLVLVVLPFVALSFYNHPSLDDFLDAVTVREQGFWEAQKSFYIYHTGRYATTFLLALVNPLLYIRMEDHWGAVAIGFMLGTLVVLRLCLGLLPGLKGTAAWRNAAILLALWLAYAPGQSEGLYWFTGAYTYLTTAWLLLLWLVAFAYYAAAQRSGKRRWGWQLVLVVLTMAVAGSTEPIALPFLLVLLSGTALRWRTGRRRAGLLLLLAGLAFAGSIASFTAPGNFVRMSSMGPSFGIVKTVLYSTGTAGYLLLTWVANPLLLTLSALVLPGLYRMARQREHWLMAALAQVPAWMLAGILALLLAAANCPAYYASGTGLPLRARTTLYLFFVVGWFGVLLTWCCRQVQRTQPATLLRVLTTAPLAPLWVSLLGLFFFTDYNVQTRHRMLGNSSNNVIRAYQQWLCGAAACYDAELHACYQMLATGGPVVAIQPLHNKPDLLYSFGVADAANSQTLQKYAHYFGVSRVVVQKNAP